MFLSSIKVEPRHNPTQLSTIRKSLKSKTSLPQTCSSGKVAFEGIKLTQSHQIQEVHTNEFQLNIIPPNIENDQSDKLGKKFSCPQWLISSDMAASSQFSFQDKQSQNPEQNNDFTQISCNDYSNSYMGSDEPQSPSKNDLLKTNKSEIQKVLEMTVSDDKERQLNETNVKSQLHCDDLDSRSGLYYGFSSQQSDKAFLTSLELKNTNNLLNVVNKPKSATVTSGKQGKKLDDYYKQEYEMYSDYGLKPYEENRLRKIQALQKMELLNDQAEDQQSQHDQQYFNLSKTTKTGRQTTKFRKCSAALLTQENGKTENQLSKKSKSRQKHSLSKDKKGTSPSAHGMSKPPSMKKSHTNPVKK